MLSHILQKKVQKIILAWHIVTSKSSLTVLCSSAFVKLMPALRILHLLYLIDNDQYGAFCKMRNSSCSETSKVTRLKFIFWRVSCDRKGADLLWLYSLGDSVRELGGKLSPSEISEREKNAEKFRRAL